MGQAKNRKAEIEQLKKQPKVDSKKLGLLLTKLAETLIAYDANQDYNSTPNMRSAIAQLIKSDSRIEKSYNQFLKNAMLLRLQWKKNTV